jgi:hypothetical protein
MNFEPNFSRWPSSRSAQAPKAAKLQKQGAAYIKG